MRAGLRDSRMFSSMARGTVDEHSYIDLLMNSPPGQTSLAQGAMVMDVQDLGRTTTARIADESKIT